MKKWLKWLCIPLMAVLCCQSAAAAPAGTAAALKETVVTPSQLAQQDFSPVSIIPHADGSVEFFAMQGKKGTPEELRRYQSKDGGKTWTEQPCKWAVPVAKAYGLYEEGRVFTEDVYVDEKGVCYFSVMGSDNIPRFIEAKPDGSYKELPMPAWKTDHDNTHVQNLTVAKTGDWIFSYYSMTGAAYMETIDRKTGAMKQRIVDEAQGWDTAFCGNTAVAGGLSNYISFYDMSTGKRTRDVKLPRNDTEWGSYETAITMDETGAYLASKHGIERVAPGGSVVETILEPNRSYLSDKNASLREFGKQPGADVFYVVMHLDDQFMICRYAAS